MSHAAHVEYAYPSDFDKTIGAWFLGPKAENNEVLEEQLLKIVRYFKHGRETYFPDDKPSITQQLIQSEGYKASIDRLDQVLEYLSVLLAHHSVPFSSPRYAAHITGDTSLPATVGYFLGMLYNQNNVSPEASPLTTIIEYVVGQDLCRMIGFNTADAMNGSDSANGHELKRDSDYVPIGWGHVTCDGSVANLESMWIARSLKYYPLSLRCAMEEGALKFVGDALLVLPTGVKEKKSFMQCSPWELLNLKSDEILGLPNQLIGLFDLSSDYIDNAVQPYLAQNKGKDWLERRFGVKTPPKYFVSIAKHYSLLKAANVLGIGEGNLVNVTVDIHARMDMKDLSAKLTETVNAGVAILGVLCIMGSTEHGAVDPLGEVLQLRREFEETYGVSFFIHADSAWGGYFLSMLRDVPKDWKDQGVNADFVKKPLLPYTKHHLNCIREADSVTIDSHKSGYCPYPAGGLCYRDDRMCYLITTTGPYINTTGEGVESMGTYGLEGSKPGAAPLAVWVANVVLGLHVGGYGSLLAQSILSGVRYYTMYSNLDQGSDSLIMKPFVILPVENDLTKNDQDVKNEKQRLARSLLRPYSELIKDKQAMDDIEQIGSDLMINTFACNFKVAPNGPVNQDVIEANLLNQRIYERFSIRRVTDDINSKPTFIVGTVFKQSDYQDCLKQYKKRLGLNPEGPEDLHTFSSVAMSPFIIDNVMEAVGEALLAGCEEEVKICQERIALKAAHHDFIMQGTDELYLTYMPMMYFGTYRQNVVITGKLPSDVMKAYVEQRKAGALITLHTYHRMRLDDILIGGKCAVTIVKGLSQVYSHDPNAIATNVELSDIKVLKNHSLAPSSLCTTYPELMPFYLYGTADQQHINHVLLKVPNGQLVSNEVKLEVNGPLPEESLRQGLIAVLTDRYEAGMQPFSGMHIPRFFGSGVTSKVSLFADPFSYEAKNPADIHDLYERLKASKPIAMGTLTLGQIVYVDNHYLNQETLPEIGLRSLILRSDHRLEPATLQEILNKLKSIAKRADVLLSQDVEDVIRRERATIGGYEIVPMKDVPNAMQISRFFVTSSDNMLGDKVAIRKGWLNAVQGKTRF